MKQGICCSCQQKVNVHVDFRDRVYDEQGGLLSQDYLCVSHDDQSGNLCGGSGTTPQAVLED